MRWMTWVAASAVASGALAAPATRVIPAERSADLLQPTPVRRTITPLLSAAAAPTVEDVGDPDSFGRNVTYLGVTQIVPVVVVPDCSASDPTFERCVVAAPAPSPTSFDESDLAVIQLPSRATRSLLCFTITPSIWVQWANPLATPATAQFTASASITIENDVLSDPTLIDPGTGLPFGGSLKLGLSTYHDVHTLQPGEIDNKTLFATRACIGGLVSRRALIESYGLSETQANQFFKKPMTLRFGARGSVALADFSNYFYGIRLYGD